MSMPSENTFGTLLPSGTVTFLFSDIEGSTQLLQRLGRAYAQVLGEHQSLLRAAWSAHDGAEIDTAGDGFFVAFASAPEAVAAAADATRALAEHRWPEGTTLRVRMGLHTGTPQLVGDHYVGLDVHRAARIAAAGYGGQVLLSEATHGLVKHELPEGAMLRELGTHRLKDLQEPEQIYQLLLPGLAADFPPLRTLDAHQHNLPIEPTPLLGREEQTAAVCSLLRRGDVRLVTLTGAGGIGKTRLAIQIAAELVEDFPDGVWFVRLSRLADSDLVLPTVAQTLGLKDRGSRPIAEILREYLHPKHLLLVLDNFEQVVGAAAGVAELRESAPHLKILVTSRVSLHLRGEREYPLSPLPLPDRSHLPSPAGLSQYAAVALFIERASSVRPDFVVTAANAPTIAEICARLDGLPLAIELAAARVKLLPPEALLARLSTQLQLLTGGARDAEERQQTMRATIAWSEALLSPAERRLFRRLAVFVGGCTLEAVESICAAPEGAEALDLEVLDGLGTLVDHSLLQQREEGGEPRFGMLHVIREYALEQLETSGEAEGTQRAHGTYYLRLVESAEAGLLGREGHRWVARLSPELDNLRAALPWARDQRELELALRAEPTFRELLFELGDDRECGRWLQELLALALPEGATSEGIAAAIRAGLPATVLARALDEAGMVAYDRGDYGEAERLLQQSLALYRMVSDRAGEGAVLVDLAIAVSSLGDREQAIPLYEASLTLLRETGDLWRLSGALASFAFCLYLSGELDRAEVLLEEALAMARALDNPMRVSFALINLGDVARLRGDFPRSLAFGRESLAVARGVGKSAYVAWALTGIGLALSGLGLSERSLSLQEGSVRLLAAGMAHLEHIGVLVRPDIDIPDFNRWVSAIKTALGKAAFTAAWDAGRAMSLEEVVAEALKESPPG
jgi:predicted ATPase/class 3 adenylate cyclase